MAMVGVNKMTLLGRLGQDPEVRHLPNQQVVANFTVATAQTWKDKQTGEKIEKTEWHRVTVFGKLAEIAGKYLQKGAQAYFEGRLQTRKWSDQNGIDRFTTEIVVDQNGVMQLIGNRVEQSQADPSAPLPQSQGFGEPPLNCYPEYSMPES